MEKILLELTKDELRVLRSLVGPHWDADMDEYEPVELAVLLAVLTKIQDLAYAAGL